MFAQPHTPRIVVAFEYSAYPPLWFRPSLRELPPLPEALLDELNAWVSYGGRHMLFNEWALGHMTLEKWNGQGLALARRVRSEIPATIEVWYHDEVTDQDVLVE